MVETPVIRKPKPDHDERKMALEEARVANEHQISLERLALDARQIGTYSTGAVTLIGAVVSLVTAVGVAAISGSFEARNARSEREQQEKAQAAEIKAAGERLVIEQNFNIIVQATKDFPVEVAVENLKFFVEAGILPDPEGKILALANKGIAPTFPDSGRVLNPLLERAADLAGVLDAPAGHERLAVADGLLIDNGAGRITYLPSPALSQSNRPDYAIIHYTAGSGAATARWLTDAQSGASAHLLIGRDGKVTQLVPFDFAAWHAGQSTFGSVSGFNRRSIGIMLENVGPVTGRAGSWRSLTGQPVADADVVSATDRAGMWQTFPPEQIDITVAVLLALREAYPEMVDMLGHSDISSRGKVDPGPLFPMADVRNRVFGRTDPLPPQ